jgi:Glycosyltransferase family 87
MIAFLARDRVASLRRIPLWELVLAGLAFFPVFDSLLQGQDSILQLLLCVLAWRAFTKHADIVAGCWLGLAAFKFQFVIPIVLLMIAWKRLRVLGGFAAVCIALAMISAGVVGGEGWRRYPAFALQIANSAGLGGVPASFLPNLRGLIAGWPFHFSATVEMTVTGLISISLFVFAAWSGRCAISAERSNLQFSLAIALSVLIAWQTNISDFSLLLLPMLLIADEAVHRQAQSSTRRYAMWFAMLLLWLSPLWLVLWLGTGSVRLMAIPLLVWIGVLCKELSHGRYMRGTA